MALLGEIERLLRQGREQATRTRSRATDVSDAVRRVYGQRLAALEKELARAFNRGAQDGVAQVGLDGIGRTLTRPETLDAYTRDRAMRLLSDMAAEQRRVLLVVDRYARRFDLAPARRLDILRAVGGLNWRQAQALLRYRDKLANRDVPTRQLRAQMVAYGDRLRRQRATMIARTEDAVAENRGREAVWREGQALGLISRRARRVWRTAADERTCPTCSAMDGVSVALDEPWDVAGVAVGSPGEVHPHCRCSEEIVEAAAKAA